MYKIINDSEGNLQCIWRIADNSFIPIAKGNTDYLEYLKWLEEGGVPLPADE